MGKKFQFSVCPHDTVKFMIEWFQFNTYLQRKLGCGIHFEPQDNFLIERQNVLDGDFHIVYANPLSALIFMQQRGFIPIAKVIDLYDETIIIAQADAKENLIDQPLKIASATDKLIVHSLGLNLLHRHGINHSRCQFQYVGNHLKVVHAVLKGDADLGFLFNETWYGLADSTRQKLKIICESTDRIAFHCFCIAPSWDERRVEIQDILLNMNNDPKGRLILDSIHFKAFEALAAHALNSLHDLHKPTLGPISPEALNSLNQLATYSATKV